MIRKGLIIGLVMLTLVALPLVAACAGDKAAPPEEPSPPGEPAPPKEVVEIMVGGNIPMTGPIAESAFELNSGREVCFEWWNETKGEELGVKVDYSWCDTKYEAPQVIACYDRMKAQGMMVLTTCGTAQILPVKEKCEVDQIPAVCDSATPMTYDPPGWTFSCWTEQCSSGQAVTEWWCDNHWDYEAEGRPPRIHCFTWDNPYGRAPIPALEYLDSEGVVEYTGHTYIAYGALDATTQLSAIKKTDPDVMMFGHEGASLITCVRDARRLGMFPEIPILCHHGSTRGDTPRLGGPEADGVLGINMMVLPYDDPAEYPVLDIIWKYVQKQRTDVESRESMDFDIPSGFLNAYIICKAVEKAVETTPAAELNGKIIKENGLEKLNVSRQEHGGLVGCAIDYTNYPDDRRATDCYRIWQIQNERWEPIVDWFTYEETPCCMGAYK